MKNDLQVEVAWFMNKDNVSELHFNYYDVNGNLVGNIYVDAKGNMQWQIVNLEYKDYLSNIINYLYMGDTKDRLSFESTDANGLRWTRARIYIANRGLLINYNQEVVFSQEEASNFIK